jgi:hypothetical protein
LLPLLLRLVLPSAERGELLTESCGGASFDCFGFALAGDLEAFLEAAGDVFALAGATGGATTASATVGLLLRAPSSFAPNREEKKSEPTSIVDLFFSDELCPSDNDDRADCELFFLATPACVPQRRRRRAQRAK